MCFMQNYSMFCLMMNLYVSKRVGVSLFWYIYDDANDLLYAFC